MSRVIIAGCRNFNNYFKLKEAIIASKFDITEVVSGGASGVDSMGERWASENNIPIKTFPAEWKKYGKLAGPIRNRQMAEYADALIALWDYKSPGTRNMVKEAANRQLKVYIYDISKLQVYLDP